MPQVLCVLCHKEFYIKPSHQKLGWGKYCSRICQVKAQFNGKLIKCYICGKEIYRSKAHLERSLSNKYFCTKSCQTIWRNSYFVAEKHANWKNGQSAYRGILKRTGSKPICFLCHIADERIIIAHHKNHNRNDNTVTNLIWLCLNCHFLVHHDKQLDSEIKNMEALV